MSNKIGIFNNLAHMHTKPKIGRAVAAVNSVYDFTLSDEDSVIDHCTEGMQCLHIFYRARIFTSGE